MLLCAKTPFIGVVSPAMGDNSLVGMALVAMGIVLVVAVAAVLLTGKKK